MMLASRLSRVGAAAAAVGVATPGLGLRSVTTDLPYGELQKHHNPKDSTLESIKI